MELTVVGSGNAAPDPERVCAGFFLQHDGAGLLLDCGPGVVHHMARFGLPWQHVRHVAISHFHTDHIGDLPALLFALKHGTEPRRSAPLTISGPVGLATLFRALAAAFGDYVLDPGFPLEIRELEPAAAMDIGGIAVRTHETPHTAVSLAYRLDVEGVGTIAYTGDTDESTDLAAFLRGADVLIAECSTPDDDPVPGHLTPSTLARMAAIADPRMLLVTHVYPPLASADVPATIRSAGWSGECIRAVDGFHVRVDRGGIDPSSHSAAP